MTKNKIIFIILGLLIFIGVAYFVLTLNNPKTKNTTITSSGDFQIWILEDDVTTFQNYLIKFKEAFPEYKEQNIIVESFGEKQSYYNAMVSALLLGKGPDVFVLENGETSPLENQALGLDASIVSPNDFRLRFKPVFGEDLIVSDPLDTTLDFIKGIPLGYEALGLYYDRKYFLRPSEMQNWENVLQEIKSIVEKQSDIIALALGNGSSVTRAADIMKELFVSEGAVSLAETSDTQSKQAFALYKAFGEAEGENNYNSISQPFIGETDIDLFTQGDVAAMVGYPRDLLAIDKIGYQKNFLFATPFPGYAGKEKISGIKYHVFTINKDTSYPDMASKLLSYMASVEGQTAYIENFPYYLPAETSVEQAFSEKKMLPQYNIIYKNFISDTATLVSYNAGDIDLFDTSMKNILDLEGGYDTQFSKIKSFIVCSSTKQQTLLNLSSPCK